MYVLALCHTWWPTECVPKQYQVEFSEIFVKKNKTFLGSCMNVQAKWDHLHTSWSYRDPNTTQITFHPVPASLSGRVIMTFDRAQSWDQLDKEQSSELFQHMVMNVPSFAVKLCLYAVSWRNIGENIAIYHDFLIVSNKTPNASGCIWIHTIHCTRLVDVYVHSTHCVHKSSQKSLTCRCTCGEISVPHLTSLTSVSWRTYPEIKDCEPASRLSAGAR